LRVCKLLIQQQNLKVGRTKRSTAPHAGRGLDIADLNALCHFGPCHAYAYEQQA